MEIAHTLRVGFACLALAASGPSQVTLPHYESFDYQAGSALTAESNDWSALWNPTGEPVAVIGGSLGSAGMPTPLGASIAFQAAPNAEDVQLQHSYVTANQLYYSFVCEPSPTPVGGYAIAMGGRGIPKGHLFARLDGAEIRFGISKGEAVPEAEVAFTVPREPHLIVLKWQHGSPDVFSLFVDPDPRAPEPAPDAVATGGLDAQEISEFLLRQESGGHGGALDELRLGLTWYSVTHPVFTLHGLFTDHMVVQRDAPVPVWGNAEDGTVIRVHMDGQSAQTTAQNRRWRVDLAPMPAGGPHTLTVSGPQTIQLSNVLVGDVWLCAGQSNMRFELQNCVNGPPAVAGSSNPALRLCELTLASADEPLDDVGASWIPSAPTSSADFSGVAWFFGDRLQRDLAVPIGLIESADSATSITTWMTNESLASEPQFAPFVHSQSGGSPGTRASPTEESGGSTASSSAPSSAGGAAIGRRATSRSSTCSCRASAGMGAPTGRTCARRSGSR
jgi:hypothetical protein